jgi:hypothetical protein
MPFGCHAKVRILLEHGPAHVTRQREGSVASFATEQEFEEKASFPGTLGCHIEEFIDEAILTLEVMPAQPPLLSLPNHVHRLIALNRSSRGLELMKPLLSVHSSFDRAMVLMMFFRYWMGRWRHRLRSVPSFFMSAMAEP